MLTPISQQLARTARRCCAKAATAPPTQTSTTTKSKISSPSSPQHHRPFHTTIPPNIFDKVKNIFGRKNDEPVPEKSDTSTDAAAVSAVVSAVGNRMPTESLPEKLLEVELHASEDVRRAVAEIDRKLKSVDEVFEEATELRIKRRALLLPVREQMRQGAIEQTRIQDYKKEREALVEEEKTGIVYFHRHLLTGKVYASDTQYLNEKEFHHQMGLKTHEKIIKLRRDHWEPFLAVTGLPYARDVRRILCAVVDEKRQEIDRLGRRVLKQKTGTKEAPYVKPHPQLRRAVFNMVFAKRYVTTLAAALKKLHSDCGDLDDVKILWSREHDRDILLRAGLDDEALAENGTWPKFIRHGTLEVRLGKIKNLTEDISYEIESRVRQRLQREMPAPGEPFYPLLKRGRQAFLQSLKEKTGKSDVLV